MLYATTSCTTEKTKTHHKNTISNKHGSICKASTTNRTFFGFEFATPHIACAQSHIAEAWNTMTRCKRSSSHEALTTPHHTKPRYISPHNSTPHQTSRYKTTSQPTLLAQRNYLTHFSGLLGSPWLSWRLFQP